jgi:two-component system, chemotaxis family, sensor kinase CheA
VTETDVEFLEIFRDEANERLDAMVEALLALEQGSAPDDAVDSLFREAHTIKGSAAMLELDEIRALAHAVEDVLSDVRKAGVFPPELTAPLLLATDRLRAQVAGQPSPADDLLEELARVRADLAGSRNGRKKKAGPAASKPAGRRTVRVPADKIDQLLDLVGETMLHQRRLEHTLVEDVTERLDVAEELGLGERLLDKLKDTAIGMRTLPLASITAQLPRAVRDLAVAGGKDVELVVVGSETELDRLILEGLSEPLVHLLRNAVAHGIEPAAERKRAGKPTRGRVELRAEQRGSFVEIVVADDGGGVSPETLEEARQEGSLTELLARPGYSTVAEVTELAGRGVGLDAVRSHVRAFGGSLEIRSEPGRGTEVVLLLPLALALLEVLLVERGTGVYGLPLGAVEEVLTPEVVMMLEGRPSLELHGRSFPLHDLAALVGAAAPDLRERPPTVVIAAAGRRVAVSCDALLGETEVVVKPLGALLAGVDGYLGAAILGDGRIALLLQPGGLVHGPRGALHAPVPAVGAPAAAPKILVVEDSFTVRELQRSILEAAGYRVATARDGRDALEVLGRDTEVALVLTDLEMPELDGLELTRAIRAAPSRSALPVVIVTSRASDDDRRQGIEAGADAYMAKGGFDQQALLETVHRLVGR